MFYVLYKFDKTSLSEVILLIHCKDAEMKQQKVCKSKQSELFLLKNLREYLRKLLISDPLLYCTSDKDYTCL